MLTGEIKNKVDRIWETFWTGGVTNPLTVIEQFTYLIFIKSLDDKQVQSEAEANLLGVEPKIIFDSEHEDLRWHNFKEFDAEKMYDTVANKVFPFIKKLNGDSSSSFSKYMGDAMFQIPTPLMLQKIVNGIDELELEGDIKGDLYEYLLSKLSTSGTNGQFRTPRHIIKMMVELMKPTPSDIIIDPACGTSGFLIGASEYLKDKHGDLFNSEELKYHYNNTMFNGNDMDSTMLRIGTMNMLLHDVENPQIEYRDSLSKRNTDREKYTLVLANPPFKGSLDEESVADDLLRISNTKRTEILFLSLMLRILKSGGRCAVIVPDGVLFGSTKAHKSIREEIVEKNKLEAVISMPSGVFKPYAGVSTAILIFTKTGIGGTDNVWFYDMEADGYSLDDKREKIEDSDIEDIIERFNNIENEKTRERTEKSFLVPKEEIAENNYDLSINRYKEIVYEEIEYEAPEKIIGYVRELEEEVYAGLDKIEKLVK
ncbi:type I restriction-modification system subunit M [Anaerosalibacter bizertensis]|uniref:site-specific DNA-methyltransferase (adenine-specific) n=1 Tax=Anaerosalibacter bizertensis TaxID=932217 RepID=A0A9Q4AAL7_9FIRM|nr:class I SAM-dependent DNA methyltransferase [Anaerosalibacter bizertensis]MBV1818716.1 type I restriction-modification system subunit M [Bacteroidales bacterium MSK.15.36]MCB5558815.1 type I restriction-modification system subunit M [Anaerosalibacter bizertensis]MCG4564177.1 type I restriction-modification system subunit M [Anaerosalibacter bizertensis]MCG4581842.1 type I restriction-modification system subunit M [Anaerosalibacter bizertensis]